jgi:hypothetical protein
MSHAVGADWPFRTDLAAALAEVERLALATCRHRAAAVDGGTCMACGTEV